MPDSRYQFQSLPVKLGRWLRHRPKWFAIGIGNVIDWVLRGAKVPPPPHPKIRPRTRWQHAKEIMLQAEVQAAIAMGHVYFTSEILADLEAKRAAKKSNGL